MRREGLGAEYTKGFNAGLWLDKFPNLLQNGDIGTHMDALKSFTAPAGYEQFVARFERSLSGSGSSLMGRAKVHGRMAVGLGADCVLENSLSLHKTYGVPVIPGSALKGLAARAARSLPGWTKESDAYKAIFGGTEESGTIVFHDALWIPNGNPFQLDVTTNHHQQYYADGSAAPAEWDQPIPISFLSVGGTYLFALSFLNEAWRPWAKEVFGILQEALKNAGIGAKTSSGYGRMTLEEYAPVTPQDLARKEREARALRRVETIKNLTIQNVAQGVPELLKGLEGDELRTVALKVIEKLGKKNVQGRTAAWAVELLKAAGLA